MAELHFPMTRAMGTKACLTKGLRKYTLHPWPSRKQHNLEATPDRDARIVHQSLDSSDKYSKGALQADECTCRFMGLCNYLDSG